MSLTETVMCMFSQDVNAIYDLTSAWRLQQEGTVFSILKQFSSLW